jgi:ATP-dependent RNA helicase DeaD
MSTFHDYGLKPEILRAIDDLGFTQPTPIQERIIPAVLLSDDDLVGLAQTGTGKTAAFGLPLTELSDLSSGEVQSLVLCPTRELCMQITGDMASFSKYLPGFHSVAVYGGASVENQVKAIKRGAQVVVGTPGRVLDLIRRKALKVSHIRWLVLDEADEMLNMGFKEDLDAILSETPKKKRTLLFSATMPKEISEIAGKYMHDPIEIAAGKRNVGAENVKHDYYIVQARDRYEALKRLADIHPHIYGIVFCRTRAVTQEIADKLIADGYDADALHGELSQSQRDHVMNRFRSNRLQILVATDVAARGLDVNDLSHIINYDLPDDLDTYIHRSGRTARAGKTGTCISIIHSKEAHKIRELEKITGKKFELKKVPGGREICEKQLFNLIDKVETVEVNESEIEQYLPVIYKKLEWLSREELIKHFVSVEFNRFLAYYENSGDLNVTDTRKPQRKGDERASFVRFHINLGLKNRLNASRLIGLINDVTRSRDIAIGKIEILKKFSFFEVDSRFESQITQGFKSDVEFEGTWVEIERSNPVRQGAGSDGRWTDGRRTEGRSQDGRKKDGQKKDWKKYKDRSRY